MSFKSVNYRCRKINKEITVTEEYNDIADLESPTKISCSNKETCNGRDCKFFGTSNPNLYIDAPY